MCTVWGGKLCKMFCNMFSGSSPCLLGQHGSHSSAQLSEGSSANISATCRPRRYKKVQRTSALQKLDHDTQFASNSPQISPPRHLWLHLWFVDPTKWLLEEAIHPPRTHYSHGDSPGSHGEHPEHGRRGPAEQLVKLGHKTAFFHLKRGEGDDPVVKAQ